MRTTPFALLAVLGLCLAVSAQEGMPWQPSVDAALEKAKAENRPMMVCMHWMEEKASVQMLETVYTDPEVQRAMKDFALIATVPDAHDEISVKIDGAEKTVSKYFKTVDCDTMVRNEARIKELYFDTPTVTVPQHIFVAPDGKIIEKKTYLLDKKKFLKLMEDVMIEFTGVASDSLDLRIQGWLAQVKKGEEEERKDAIRSLIETGDDRTIELLYFTIQSIRKDKDRAACIRDMGYKDLSQAGPILMRWLDDRDDLVQNSAVVSLEEVEHTQAAPALIELFDKTREKEIKKDCLRALGPCGIGNPKALEVLHENAEGRKEDLREASYIALGHHVSSGTEETRALLKKAYDKEGGSFGPKAAILYALTIPRDPELAADIDELIEGEGNKQLKDFGTAAAKILRGEQEDWGWGLRKTIFSIFSGDKVMRNRAKEWAKLAAAGRRR